MSAYSIQDLVQLLQTEGCERVLLEVGFSPTIVIKGELREVEGPSMVEEAVDEMIREVASTRALRAYRECGQVDFFVSLEGHRVLVRAVCAFGVSRLELQRISV